MGGTTTYRYRPDRIVTAEEDPLVNITRYEYTEYSEPYRVTDPEGRITGYGYDEKGNLTSVTYPDGTEEKMCIRDSITSFQNIYYRKRVWNRQKNNYKKR